MDAATDSDDYIAQGLIDLAWVEVPPCTSGEGRAGEKVRG